MNREEYARMYAHEQTHWWYVGMRMISAALLEGRVGDKLEYDSRLEILDAGCGTGAGLQWLARYGRATGVDLSGEALAFCRDRGLSRLARASIEHLPFPDERFDLVTSFDVLYHQWVANDDRALRECRRVLRPGGWLLLRVPALGWLAGGHDVALQTRHRYARGELVARLDAAGFAVERASYANCLLLPLVAGRRLVERWTRDASSDLDGVPGWLNSALARVLGLEARLLQQGSLPLGVSLVALARRPDLPLGAES
jgi:SAM-dependent methyltransferase